MKLLAGLTLLIFSLWILLARPTFAGKTIQKPEMNVNPDALRSHVETLSITFGPRSYINQKNLNRTADYIATALRASGGEVREQVFEAAGSTYKNILAAYGPDTGEIIVVGAHYDTAGELPGADDNASGIAGLIELGRLLGQSELNSRVVCAAYSLEEPPFFGTDQMGSAVHAASLREAGTRVKLMICLEMIGYFSDEKGSQQFPIGLLHLFYPSRGTFIAVVDKVFSRQGPGLKKFMRRVIELPVYSINAPAALPGVDLSDHQSFWQQGYPAVMITDTAFYRNKAYHTETDTADRLDYDKMAQVVSGIYHYVNFLAE